LPVTWRPSLDSAPVRAAVACVVAVQAAGPDSQVPACSAGGWHPDESDDVGTFSWRSGVASVRAGLPPAMTEPLVLLAASR
jgi:hypothetical protein